MVISGLSCCFFSTAPESFRKEPVKRDIWLTAMKTCQCACFPTQCLLIIFIIWRLMPFFSKRRRNTFLSADNPNLVQVESSGFCVPNWKTSIDMWSNMIWPMWIFLLFIFFPLTTHQCFMFSMMSVEYLYRLLCYTVFIRLVQYTRVDSIMSFK